MKGKADPSVGTSQVQAVRPDLLPASRAPDAGAGPRPLPANMPPAAAAHRSASPVREARPAGTLASLVAPASFEAEQYRILRYTVEQRHRQEGLTTVAVTSPSGQEGKSTTAINLAGALAQASSHRVLLVEADLRRPTILEQLGIPDGAPGLAEAALDPSLGLDQLTHSCPAFNLRVIACGRPPVAPYEILRTPRVAELLAEARRLYEYVVLDTPPVLPCPDYRVLETSVDGVILVVCADRTPREMVDSALEMLDRGKILGLVFNGERRPSSRYRGYYDAAEPPRSLRTRFTWLTRPK